jgi:hypothetical protein
MGIENGIRSCDVCGATNNVVFYRRKTYLCRGHRKQMYTLGYTKPMKRELINFEDFEDRTEIIIRNNLHEETCRAIVNLEDSEKVRTKSWCLANTGYIVSNTDSDYVLLHRFITSVDKGLYIDHMDHDKLNNRRENLRICTNQENARNSKLSINSTSGVSGVIWSKYHKSWEPSIVVDYKIIHLKRSIDINVAIQTRLDAEIKYFGDFGYNATLDILSARKEGAS